MTVIEKLKQIKQIGTTIEVPHGIWTLFSAQQKQILIIDEDNICLGEDYASIEQCRAAINWYAAQLGGTIKWKELK